MLENNAHGRTLDCPMSLLVQNLYGMETEGSENRPVGKQKVLSQF